MSIRPVSVIFLIGCVTSAGCGSRRIDQGTAETPPVATETEPAAPSVRYFASGDQSRAAVVAGYPLVYTRQILPVGGDGQLIAADATQQQIDGVLDNLESLLTQSGSSLGQLVKVNAYADSDETAREFWNRLTSRLDEAVRPAYCAVITPLQISGAKIAADVIAIGDDSEDDVALRKDDGIAGQQDYADSAVMPRGGVVYLSGQADKSPLVEATTKSMSGLLGVVQELNLQASQVVQIKVFIDSIADSDRALGELKKLFPGQPLPPVSFVQWIASAPIEIEAVVHLPRSSWSGTETLRYYTPAGMKSSPTFSRVAIVQTDRQVYISGLSAEQPGDGQQQVRDVFDQLQQILSETGSDLMHLAKATYYVSDKDASDMLNQLRPEYYDPDRPPAASKATVLGVGRPERTISMDMIAVCCEE